MAPTGQSWVHAAATLHFIFIAFRSKRKEKITNTSKSSVSCVLFLAYRACITFDDDDVTACICGSNQYIYIEFLADDDDIQFHDIEISSLLMYITLGLQRKRKGEITLERAMLNAQGTRSSVDKTSWHNKNSEKDRAKSTISMARKSHKLKREELEFNLLVSVDWEYVLCIEETKSN